MRMLTSLDGGGCGARCTSAALADDAAALSEAQDRAAIEALMWRYVRALDSMDADGYAAVFTEDGTFGSGNTQRKGRADLKAMVADLKKGREERAPPAHRARRCTRDRESPDHFTGPNEARYDSYWMTCSAPTALRRRDSPPPAAASTARACGRRVAHQESERRAAGAAEGARPEVTRHESIETWRWLANFVRAPGERRCASVVQNPSRSQGFRPRLRTISPA